MTSNIRIYLSAFAEDNEWVHFVFREIILLREEWERKKSQWHLIVLHLGFDRPDYNTEELLSVVSDIDKPVFMTESAKWGLPTNFANCCLKPVSACSLQNRDVACPVYLVQKGWGYEVDDYDSDFSITQIVSVKLLQQPPQELTGWLRDLEHERPEWSKYLSKHKIFSEEVYVEQRNILEPITCQLIDDYRFDKLSSTIDISDPFAVLKIAPKWLLELEVKRLDFTVRLQNVFSAEHISFIKDLLGLTADNLLGFRNFGKKSLSDLASVLLGIYASKKNFIEPTAVVTAQSLLTNLEHSFNLLPDNARAIIYSRLGADGSRPLTLQELGDIHGLSRERIRQIEKKYLLKIAEKSFWRDILLRKLEALTHNRTEPLFIGIIELEDPWFEGFTNKLDYLASVISYFAHDVDIVRYEGQTIICRTTQNKFDGLVKELRTDLASALAVTLTKHEIAEQIKIKCLAFGVPELSEMVWEALSEGLQFAHKGEMGEVLVAIGQSVEQLISVILEEAECPLHYSVIYERVVTYTKRSIDVRRIQSVLNASPQAFLYGRGTYGTDRHLPFEIEQLNEILTTAEEIVTEFGDRRQWHATELVSMVNERNYDVADGLDEYNISIILLKSEKLVPLGRLVWVCKHQDNLSSGDRIRTEDAILTILEKEGGPLSTRELIEKVSVYRGMRSTMQIHSSEILVKLTPYTWGLRKRDLPISEVQLSTILETLQKYLELQNSGLHISEMSLIFDAAEIGHKENLDFYFMLSICSTDIRFRIWPGQIVALAHWQEAKRHTLSSGFRKVFSLITAPTSLDNMHAMVEHLLGREVDKRFISNALSRNGIYDPASNLWRNPNPAKDVQQISDTVLTIDMVDEARKVLSAY